MSGIASTLRPILRELFSDDNENGKPSSKKSSAPSALDVLQYLLQNKSISESSLRSAVQATREQHESNADFVAPTSTQAAGPSKASRDSTELPASDATTPGHRTRHISLRFFYDGAKYNGLAQNIGMDSDNSVERALFEALLRAKLVESRETSGYSRCGRTDRGVSAAGQVSALQLKSAFPLDASLDEDGTELLSDESLPNNEHESVEAWVFPRKKGKSKQKGQESAMPQRSQKILSEYPYAKILNNLLPPEIRIVGWAPVSNDFSARFSATTRTYRYFFTKRQLDLDAMRQGLQLIIGRCDFRNFCKMDVEKVYNFERVIHDASLIVMQENQDGTVDADSTCSAPPTTTTCYVQLHGQAFLWHQIRCIMQVLFMVGKRLEPPCIISELLNVTKYPGKPGYPLAPERPLVLHNCGYHNLEVGYSVQNVWTVSCQFEEQWEELTLAAARIRNGIDAFRDVSVLKDDLLQFSSGKLAERIKKQRKSGRVSTSSNSVETPVEWATAVTIPWKDALVWLARQALIPDSNGLNTAIHFPLLERSKGTTYEEKIQALKKSGKRREKFEENIIKKRKTAEEDAAFYRHMTKQGGTGL